MINQSDRIRKSMNKIAERNLAGESVRSIAKDFGCNHMLLIRIMRQMLPVSFFTERARMAVEKAKNKMAKQYPKKCKGV